MVSSNRTRCPTIVPGVQFTSSETRLASVIAATRLGCVTQMVRPYFCLGGLLLLAGRDDAIIAALEAFVSRPLS